MMSPGIVAAVAAALIGCSPDAPSVRSSLLHATTHVDASRPEAPAAAAKGASAGFDATSSFEAGARDASADASSIPAESCRPGTFDVCLSPPERGFLLRGTTATIMPGEDLEWCEVMAVPGGREAQHHVNDIEGVASPDTHHLHVRLVMPGSDADRASVVGQRTPCTEDGREPFGTGFRDLYAQDSFHGGKVYPAGTAVTITGGQKVLFDYHFINTSLETESARAVISFSEIAGSDVRREVARFGMSRTGFRVPPDTSATFVTDCRMRANVAVLSLTRHTHRFGTRVAAWQIGGANDHLALFESDDGREHVTEVMNAPVILAAGQGILFECAYQNTSGESITYGTGVDDEMCVLYGEYTSTQDGEQPLPEDCVANDDAPGQTARGAACENCPPGE